MSFDPGPSHNPYQAPLGGQYIAPPPGPGADVPMILGIISIVVGVVAVPLSCCVCFGIPAGALAVILGIVALVIPAQPGSPGKMLGIGGIVLGLVPFIFFAVMMIISAFNPQPALNNNNPPFNFNVPAAPEEGEK